MANQWDKIAIRNTTRLTKVAQKSFIAAGESVMMIAPVDKGLFKNSFFTEINGISTKTNDIEDKAGTARKAEARAASLRLKAGDSISFVSNSSYALPLEYGHSDQAPSGMVRVTAANWTNIVAEAVKGVK